jgi:hypothetical protein
LPAAKVDEKMTHQLFVEVPRVNRELISVLPDFGKKKETWKDSLFPHHKSSPSIEPPRIQPTTE